MKSDMVEALGLLPSAPDGFASLRQLILDLAMSGRLVAQNSEDEPAHVLSARIVKARTELFGATKVRGAGKDDGAASSSRSVSLPSSWLMVPLTDVYVTVSANGGQLLSSQIVGTGKFPVVDQGKMFIAGYTDREDLVIKLPGPVVVFGDHTTERKYIDFDFVVGADGVKILRPILVNERFFWLQLVGYRLESRGYARHFKVLNACWFALPPLGEQHRIVAKVDELMALCDRLEARQQDAEAAHARLVQVLLDSLTQARDADEFQACWQRVAEHLELVLATDESVDAVKHAVLRLAFSGRLLGGAFARTGDSQTALPDGWREVQIADIAVVGTGATPARTNSAYFDPPEFHWVTSGETSAALINATVQLVSARALAETNLTIYPPGTLIVAMYGQGKTRGQVSELAIKACTNQACAAIQLKDSSPGHRQYVKYFFEKSYDELRELAAGGAQPNLNLGKIKSTLIPLPPLEEQRRIVVKVTELLALCDQLKARIAAARAKHALLAEALVEAAVA